MMKNSRRERIKSWLAGKKAPPWSIQIQPSNRCNLNCLFCCRRFEKPEKDKISDKRLLELVREAYEIGVRHVELTGRIGEPLFRTVSYRMMKKIKEYGMEGNLLTNGTLLTSGQIRKLVELGWDSIVFSLDGPTQETHDHLRGKNGVFDGVVNVIKKINFWKEELNQEKPTMLFLTVINSLNYDKLEDMVKLAHELEVKIVQVRPMIMHALSGKKLDHLKIKKTQLPSLLASISKAHKLANVLSIDLCLEHDLKTLVGYIESGYRRSFPKKYEDKDGMELKKGVEGGSKEIELRCLLPFCEMIIFAEGTVSPCCVIWKPKPEENFIDSILNKRLDEVWYGKCFNNFRSKMIKGIFPSYCKNCFL
ncbi:MAG: radical SAM protein [Candidatus Aenigmarchaeota archaeon]|nr:radical SAM protein [Candidatus Aenigmarchaeota archaeon]